MAPSRWPRRLGVAAATLAAIVACAIGVALFLVDADAVKRAVERRVAQSAGGEVTCESVTLELFPRPRAEFSGATVRVPGLIDGRIARVRVAIAWLPLLAGHVRPTTVHIERPVLEARVEPGHSADAFAAYRAVLGPLVDALARDAPGVSFRVEQGELVVVHAGRRVVSLSELDGAADVSAGAVFVTVSATADAWRTARAEATIVPGTLAGTVKLQVGGLRAGRLLDAYGSHEALRVRLDVADVMVDAATDGRATVSASLTASAPQAEIARAGRTLGLGAVRVVLDARRDSDALVVALREFRAADLVPGATGMLRAKGDGTTPVLELQVPVLDLGRAGAAALAVAGDLGPVRTSVGGLTGGTLRELTLRAAAADLGRLADPSAIRAEARIDAAIVAVPPAGIVVKNGSGRFLMAEGILQGSELAGEIGRSSFSSGVLALELQPSPRLRRLRAALNADLGDALGVARVLLERPRHAWMDGIEVLAGRAAGTLDYDAGRRASPLILDVLKIRATGHHRSVPFPLEVSSARLRYGGEGLRVRGLAGRAGRSSVRDGNMDLDPAPSAAVRSASGDYVILLDEMFPWLHASDPSRPALGWITALAPLLPQQLKGLTGTARVRLSRLSGSLATPADLDFEATIEPEQVRIEATALPAPLILSAGAGEITRRALTLKRLALAAGDTRMTVSGTLHDYAAAALRGELELAEGTIGEQGLDWMRARFRVPGQLMPRAPLEIAAARVQWSGAAGAPSMARGRVRAGGAVDVDFDLAWHPGELRLEKMAVKDADSNVSTALHWKPGSFDLAFSGVLDGRTLARALSHPPAGRGAIRGDFRAAVDAREPQRSSATGTVEGENLDLTLLGTPVVVERARLDAKERVLHVRESSVVVAGGRLGLSGTIESREERLVLDARVTADALDGARLRSVLWRARPAGAPPGAAWDLPVEGIVVVNAASVAFGERVLQPFAAVVSVAPNRVAVKATDARLCGITVPFSAALAPGSVTVSARLTARNQALADTVSCLAPGHLAVTGTYDLDAELSASGSAESLAKAVRGTFRFAARAGHIQRAAALSRALAVDEVAARAQDTAADLTKGGLAYEEITAAGTVEAGRVRLEHGMLDSSSLGVTATGEIDLTDGSLALQGLIAPFDANSRALRRVPGLGAALGASLVVIPVSIGGSVGEPEVKVLRAAAVAATLVNLMSVRFLFPINLFDAAGGKAQREFSR